MEKLKYFEVKKTLEALLESPDLILEYKKKSLSKLDIKKDYEEIDTRLASGWYVNSLGGNKKKKYKTKEVSFKISKKSD